MGSEPKMTKSSKSVKDEYKCWHCPDGVTVGEYKVFHAITRTTEIARFCINPQCNLLKLSFPGDQKGSHRQRIVHRRHSWDNRKAFCAVPALLRSAYIEACKSFVNDCYLATALLCRSMIVYAAKYKEYVPKDNQKSSFTAPIKYLLEQGLVFTDAQGILHDIRKLGGNVAHNPKSVTKEDALSILVSLDVALKDIYFDPGMKNLTLEDWFVVLIRVLVDKKCADEKAKVKTLDLVKVDNPMIQEVFLPRMYENDACKKVVQKIIDEGLRPDTLLFDNMLYEMPGRDCMEFLTSLLKSQKLIDEHAT